MARYEIGIQKASGAAAGAVLSLTTGSSRDIRLSEIGITAVTAVAGEVGVGRAANTPVGTTTAGVGQALDPQTNVAAANTYTAWSTAPTVPTVPMRRFQLPASIGAGVIWNWPSGIVIPVSSSLVIWQYSTAAVTYDIYISYDE